MTDTTDRQYECYACAEKDAEIERLTDEIVNLEAVAKDRYCKMQTEIERLRDALQEIWDCEDGCPNCKLIARAALEDDDERQD